MGNCIKRSSVQPSEMLRPTRIDTSFDSTLFKDISQNFGVKTPTKPIQFITVELTDGSIKKRMNVILPEENIKEQNIDE
mgnify:CR=1 FL=1